MKRLLILVIALLAAWAASASAGTIYVRTLTPLYPAAQAQTEVAAIDAAFQLDFNPVWGTNTRLVFSQFPPAKAQVIAVIAKTDSAPDSLGYHDVSMKGTLAYGVVLAQTTLEYKQQISGVLSHEAFEMAGDPLTETAVKVARRSYPFYLQETADPVERESYMYTRDGILISDFVTPNWFVAGGPGPWDFTQHTTRPLQILPGGYQIAWSKTKQKWVELH